jgi:hypothetical protein
MTTQTTTIASLLNQISSLSTVANSGRVRQAMTEFGRQATAEERDIAKKALSKRLNELADEGEQELQETAAFLQQNGVRYSLDEWLTVANYARKYAVDTQLVSNWISRKAIPANCVVELNALNNIRLAVSLRDRLLYHARPSLLNQLLTGGSGFRLFPVGRTYRHPPSGSRFVRAPDYVVCGVIILLQSIGLDNECVKMR